MFGPDSVAGTYAVTVGGQGGQAPFAALGLLRFDGAGRAAGFLLENRRGAGFGERALQRVEIDAAFALDADGLGVLGDPGEPIAHLAVRAAVADGVVPELGLVFRELDASTGALRTGVLSRLPDAAVFGVASLTGRYVGMALGQGGQATAAGFGLLRYDGAGGFEERNLANIPGESFRERRFVHGSDRGAYTVAADGTGGVAGGAVRFVITRASLRDGVAIAEAYGFFAVELVPVTAAHFTGTVRRIGD